MLIKEKATLRYSRNPGGDTCGEILLLESDIERKGNSKETYRA